MAVIGRTTSNASEQLDNGTTAFANKFTAPSSFDPLEISTYYYDGWGSSGNVHFAIYSDNAGAVGTKLWSGSVSYYGYSQWIKRSATISGLSLTSGTVYWLVVLVNNTSGTHWISVPTQTGTGQIKKWTEATPGTWTDNPTTSDDAAEEMEIWATDVVFKEINKSDTINVSESISTWSSVLTLSVSDNVGVSESFDSEIDTTIVEPPLLINKGQGIYVTS